MVGFSPENTRRTELMGYWPLRMRKINYMGGFYKDSKLGEIERRFLEAQWHNSIYSKISKWHNSIYSKISRFGSTRNPLPITKKVKINYIRKFREN